MTHSVDLPPEERADRVLDALDAAPDQGQGEGGILITRKGRTYKAEPLRAGPRREELPYVKGTRTEFRAWLIAYWTSPETWEWS